MSVETELIENTSLMDSSVSKNKLSNSLYLNEDLILKFKDNEKNLTVVPIDKEAPSYDKYHI